MLKVADAPKDGMIVSVQVMAAQINACHREALAAADTAVSKAVEAGQKLTEVKAREKDFNRWVSENCDFTIETARRYVRAADFYGRRNGVPGDHKNLARLLEMERSERETNKLQQEQEAAELLMSGASQKLICQQLGIGARRVKEIYEEEVMPVLLERDWASAVAEEEVPVVAAAQNHQTTIGAHAKFAGEPMGAYVARVVSHYTRGGHADDCGHWHASGFRCTFREASKPEHPFPSVSTLP